jgi:hypothetical protein
MGPKGQQPNPQGAEVEPPPLPALAKPEAANEIGKGLSERVSTSVDNTGKALAAVAGVGAFFYAAGYFVEWQKFRRGGLPPEELLPLLPRGQIAAAGVKELFISFVFGGALLGFVGWGLVWLARKAQKSRALWAKAVKWGLFSHELLVPTAVVGAITLLIVPLDKAGVIVTAILTALFYCMLRLVHDFVEKQAGSKFPLWQLSLAVGLAAIVLTGARQWEFPEPRPHAIVFLEDDRILSGAYIASDSDKILIRRGGDPTRLLVLDRSKVKAVRLEKSSFAFHRAPSLLDRASHALLGTNLDFSCIPPECRWGDNTRFGPSSAF